jgi:hypothetical protein
MRRLRETERSVRAYFFLSGVMSLVVAASYLGTRSADSVFAWFTLLADIPLSVAYVVAGVRLPRALRTDPAWILRLLVIARALFIIEDVLDMTSMMFAETAPMVGMLIGPSFSIAITYYLARHVRTFAVAHRRRARADQRVAGGGGTSVWR